MKPTSCTLLLNIFISTSLHVSGNCVPIIWTTYCIYATLVFFTLYGWLSGLLHTYLPMKMEQSVQKRRNIKFRRRGITQKKAITFRTRRKFEIEKNLVTARVSMLLKSRVTLICFRACFVPGRAKDLSAPRVCHGDLST